MLDPPTWSGGNTTLEGLANDVPNVTWPSPLMRARVTMAVLQRMGITETIAGTIDDYVGIAVRLAQDIPWRMSLKRRMAETKQRVYRDREYVNALEDFLGRALRGREYAALIHHILIAPRWYVSGSATRGRGSHRPELPSVRGI